MSYTDRSFLRRHGPIANCLFAFLLCLAIPTAINAQSLGANRGDSAGTSGGRAIQGRVFQPSGKTPDSGVRITLESPYSGTRTTVADGDGAFTFNNLAAGPYQVTIDAGKDFEIARESVNIEGAAPVYQIPVYLRLKAENNPAFFGVPKPAIDLYNKGSESGRKGDSKKAVEQLRAAVDLYPQFALALNELGVHYLRLAQPDKAAEALQAALKLRPDEVSPRLNYGIALLNLKRLEESEKELRQVLKTNDAMPTAHMYLGIALMSQRKLDEAEKELLKATQANSLEVAMDHRYLGGIYWGKRDYKRAADELETYLKLVPKAADAEKTKAAIKELRSK